MITEILVRVDERIVPQYAGELRAVVVVGQQDAAGAVTHQLVGDLRFDAETLGLLRALAQLLVPPDIPVLWAGVSVTPAPLPFAAKKGIPLLRKALKGMGGLLKLAPPKAP